MDKKYKVMLKFINIFVSTVLAFHLYYLLDLPSLSILLITIALTVFFEYTANSVTKNFKGKYKIPMLLLAVIFSLLFTSIYSSVQLQNYNDKRNVAVEITPSSDKNKNSKSNEIWIEKVTVDGIDLDLATLKRNGTWDLKYNMLFHNSSDNNDTLKWVWEASREVDIQFLSHDWSGKVNVKINDSNRVIDLYNETQTKVNITDSNNVSWLHIINYKTIFIFMIYLYLFYKILSFIQFQLSTHSEFVWIQRVILYALPTMIAISFYWMVYFPGLMSADSLNQWGQFTNFSFDNNHPVVHTLFNWLITRIWLSPAMVVLFQVSFLGLTLGLGMATMEKIGVKKKYVIIASVITALLPSNGMLPITLWKDIPYSTTLLLLTTALMWISFGIIDIKKFKWQCFLSVILIFTGTLRHNGILPMIGVIVVFVWLYRTKLKVVRNIVSMVILGMFLVTYVLNTVFNVKPTEDWLKISANVHQLAAAVSADFPFTEDERKLLNDIYQMEEWEKHYNPHSVDPLIHDSQINREKLQLHTGDVLKIWFHVLMEDPWIFVKHQIKLTSIVWEVVQPEDSHTYTTQRGIDPNNLGLKSNGNTRSYRENVTKFIEFTEQREYNWFLWRAGIQLYIIIGGMVLFLIKRKSILFLSTLPALLNTAGLMLTIPAQHLRYVYSNILIAPIILLVCIKIISEYRNEHKTNSIDMKEG